MPYYRRVGEIPPKRHTRFRQPDGSLYAEELMGEEGFEASLGASATEELAVMIDTFRPLHLGPGARDSEDDKYAWSWLGGR